jgi:hypothetical protein
VRTSSSPSEKTLTESLCREFTANNESGVCAFVLSTILEDESLVRRTTEGAFAAIAPHNAQLRVSAEWEARLVCSLPSLFFSFLFH